MPQTEGQPPFYVPKAITAKEDETDASPGGRLSQHVGRSKCKKYDQSSDTLNFCKACAVSNDINGDYCLRCRCPRLV